MSAAGGEFRLEILEVDHDGKGWRHSLWPRVLDLPKGTHRTFTRRKHLVLGQKKSYP